MEHVGQKAAPDAQKKTSAPPRNYWRLFALVLVIALLGQLIGFIQMQIGNYHRALLQDFKLLAVAAPIDNKALATIEEDLNALPEVRQVKLFSPQEGLQHLQNRNPRMAQAMVALGRNPMPAYFEVRVHNAVLPHIRSFADQLSAQYTQLTIKYSAEQADMAFYSGLCLRTINILAAFVLVLLLVFMFMVEAYPTRVSVPRTGAVVAGVLAGLVSFGLVAAAVYPTGLLAESLQHFTSWERQIGQGVLCGLLGWTLGKWQKF